MPTTPSTSIHWNDATPFHDDLIRKLLSGAKRFDCAVAFAKVSGLRTIYDALVRRLKHGMKARFLVGLDFCQTQPECLDLLLKLGRKYDLSVYVGAQDRSWTFHPKIYRFDYGHSV